MPFDSYTLFTGFYGWFLGFYCKVVIILVLLNSFNPFHVTGFFLYPMKILESLWFSDVLRGTKKAEMLPVLMINE